MLSRGADHESKWAVVVIGGSDVAELSARSLIQAFDDVYRNAGLPAEVEVYHAVTSDGGHHYYFSPAAAEVGSELLAKWAARPCAKLPDLSVLRLVQL